MGRFDKEIDAANARLQAEIDHFGEARNIKKSLIQDFNQSLNKKKYNISNMDNKNQSIEIELSYNEYNKVNEIIKYFSNLLIITET
jgi:transcription-repair coupling factor (superfamily II helicase)